VGVQVSDQIVGLINPGMSLIFAGGGFALWLRDRSMVHVLGYVLAAILIGFSFGINHYAADPGQTGVQIIIAVLAIAAVISLVWSMCHRLRQPVPMLVWLGTGLGTVVLVALADHTRDVSAGLLAVNLCCGVVMVMGTQIMAQARSTELVDRLLVWIFAAAAVQFFVRPLGVIMLGGEMSTIEYRSSAGHAVLVVTAALFTLLMTGAILAATISDQIKAVKQAVRQDELSGLLHRSAFEKEARAVLARAQAERLTVTMVIADIDHFKRVNDRWGHPAGDAAIRAFGHLITATIRPNDCAGRIGGEEFCILAWNCPGKAAGNLAERMRTALASQGPAQLGAVGVLTASFGVAEWNPGDGYDDLYARADAALYRAKKQGRNQVVIAGDEATMTTAELAPAPAPRLAASSARAPARNSASGQVPAAAIARGA
jgi:diguanylate cyclase (GGDEF)-like protein